MLHQAHLKHFRLFQLVRLQTTYIMSLSRTQTHQHRIQRDLRLRRNRDGTFYHHRRRVAFRIALGEQRRHQRMVATEHRPRDVARHTVAILLDETVHVIDDAAGVMTYSEICLNAVMVF